MHMDYQSIIRQLADDFFSEAVGIRRHLHRYPELSTQEHKTAIYISQWLTKWGIPHQTGVAGTGVVGLITGNVGTGSCLALRADMDALPIKEETNLPYASLNQGVMHACGHDVHMTSLLGTAYILNSMKDHFAGSVKLIFQPSEECFPGGAIKMIEEGVLENPKVDAIFGQHVLPQLEAGKIGLKPGMYMASTDEIYITVKGKGGHAATPELLIDPVLIASHVVVALQQVVSRYANPAIPSVLSFGRIIADGRTNIIPDTVTIDGTFRTFNEEWRADALKIISSIATNTARAMGGDCDVRVANGYPFLVNDTTLTSSVKRDMIEMLGEENIIDLPLRMTAEDFAYFTHLIPGVYYRLGTGSEAMGITSNLHTSSFDVDETSIRIGMSAMSNAALCFLKEYTD